MGGQKKHTPNPTGAAPREQHSSDKPKPPLAQTSGPAGAMTSADTTPRKRFRIKPPLQERRRRRREAERGPPCCGRNAARHSSGTGAGPPRSAAAEAGIPRGAARLRSEEEAVTAGAGPGRAAPHGAPRRTRGAPLRSAATRTCPQRAPHNSGYSVLPLRGRAGTLRRRPQPHPPPRHGRSAAAPLSRWMSGAGPAAPSAARTASRRDEGRAAPGAPL